MNNLPSLATTMMTSGAASSSRISRNKTKFWFLSTPSVGRCFSSPLYVSCRMVPVVAVILLIDRTVLLCQRRASARYGLQWEFPGGKAEPGEPPESCLCRELFEELMIHPYESRFFYRDQFVYPDSGTFDVTYYLITSYCGAPTNCVFEQIRWISLPELPTFDILEGNRRVVNELLRAYEVS